MWYGKGPGVDRCGDVLKHGNAAGTSKYGGVLICAGDDHGASSSTLPHQSDHIFMAAMVPILYPANVQDAGLRPHGLGDVALFGRWVGFKSVAEVVESAGFGLGFDPDRVRSTMPNAFDTAAGRAEHPLAGRYPRAGRQAARHKVLCRAGLRPDQPDRPGTVIDSPRSRASASRPAASPISMSGRRCRIWASTTTRPPGSASGSTRSA